MCFSVGACVCLRHHHHFASYHHIILHNITSYIISHQRQKDWIRSRSSVILCWIKMCWGTKQIFDKKLLNENVLRHEGNLRKIQFYQICHRRGFFLYEAWKEGKVFCRQRLKNGMCANFMHRKEIYYSNFTCPINCSIHQILQRILTIKLQSIVTTKSTLL